MELDECLAYLHKLTNKGYKESDITKSPVLRAIKNFFGIDFEDVLTLLMKRPDLLSLSGNDFEKNIETLSERFNLKTREFKNLVMKIPAVLLIRESVLTYKIKLVSKIFDTSSIEAVQMIYLYPALLTVTKDMFFQSLDIISSSLKVYDISLRKLLRSEPRLLFVSKEQILSIKDCLKSYSFGETDICSVIKENPSILLLKRSSLEENIRRLFPAAYSKKELREITPACPYFLMEDPGKFFDFIEEKYGVNKKSLLSILRSAPWLSLSGEIRIKEVLSLGINKELAFSYPKVFSLPRISLFLRLMLARVMKLDKEFLKIMDMKLETLVHRFLFMQYYGYFDYNNILLSGEKFNETYRTNEDILSSFNFDARSLSRTIEFYLKERGGIDPKIDLSQILSFLGALNVEPIERGGIFQTLLSLNLSVGEAAFVVEACPYLINFPPQNTAKIFLAFKKFGVSNEEIINILIAHPSILAFSFRDFEVYLKDISYPAVERIKELF